MTQNSRFNISSFTLHILAMGLMLCDHAWAMLFPAEEWLTCIGRMAYPIFAFMIVEGYAHTHDLRRYMLRILLWACLSEVPFNIMYGGSVFYPLLQFICLYILNVELLGGYYYTFQLLGHEIELVQQGLAVISLIPIWLYQGRQGFHNKVFQWSCYAFYPIHIIILIFLRYWLLR